MEVLQRTANRGSISTGSYQIDNSLKFERDNSESIVTTNQAAGNQKTWTFSAWIKRSRLSYDWDNIFGAGNARLIINEQNDLIFTAYSQSNTYSLNLQTNRVFRDTSAFYHIVAQVDTTQSTASNRAKIWVNGVQETSFSTETYPNQNDTFDVGGQGSSSNWLQLGRFYSGSRHFSGYMAEVHYLNGTAEDADAFGEYDEDSGIWIPKEYTGGGYGTQGFYYKFDNSANLGEDSSGEGHDANSLNNITSANQATDTPTNNFCTFNPLINNNASGNYLAITNGGTLATQTANNYAAGFGTMGVSSGKWYFEIKIASGASNAFVTGIGIGYQERLSTSLGHTVYMYDAVRYNNDGNLGTFSSATYGLNDIISIALDMDASTPTCTVYKNGTAGGNLFASLTPASGSGLSNTGLQSDFYFPYVTAYSARTLQANFGGFDGFTVSSGNADANGYGNFEYAPPSGYYAICTKNLAEFG